MFLNTFFLLAFMGMAYARELKKICTPLRIKCTNLLLLWLRPQFQATRYYIKVNSLEGAFVAAYLKRSLPDQEILAVTSSPCIEFAALHGVSKNQLDLIDSAFDTLAIPLEWRVTTKKVSITTAETPPLGWESTEDETPYRAMGSVFYEPVIGWVKVYYRLLSSLDGVVRSIPKKEIVHVIDMRSRKQAQTFKDAFTVQLQWTDSDVFEPYPLLVPALQDAIVLEQQSKGQDNESCQTYSEMYKKLNTGTRIAAV
jgi:hypothetical protein